VSKTSLEIAGLREEADSGNGLGLRGKKKRPGRERFMSEGEHVFPRKEEGMTGVQDVMPSRELSWSACTRGSLFAAKKSRCAHFPDEAFESLREWNLRGERLFEDFARRLGRTD